MATVLDELIVKLGAETDLSGFRRLESRVERTRARLDSLAAGLFKVGVAVTGAATAAVTEFAGFESEISKIEGLVGVSRDQLDAWRKDLVSISRETGKAPRELAKALFFVTSAGLRGAEAIDVLRQSARASAAGLGDQVPIVDLLTSAINAYGSENLTAQQATDALTEAVRLGKLEPGSLAAAMGRVLPVSSAMGVQFNEIAGLMAAMSRTGTTAEESVTQLTAVMSGLLNPGSSAEKALSGVGLSVEQLRKEIRDKGLFSALRTLQTAFHGNNEALVEVFPNIRALRGIFDLLGPGLKTNIGLLEEMKSSVGVTDEAFEAAANTLQFRASKSVAIFRSALVDMGERLKPVAIAILDFADRAISAFQKLPDSIKTVIATILSLGPVILGAAVGAKALSLALGGFGPAVRTVVSGSNFLRSGLVSTFTFLTTGFSTAFQFIRTTATTAFAFIVRKKRLLDSVLAFVGWKGLLMEGFRRVQASALLAFGKVRSAALAVPTSIGAIRTALIAMRATMISSFAGFAVAAAPLLPIILGIAAAAALLIASWKPISTFFSGLWGGLTEGTGRVSEAFGRLLDALGPVGEGIRAGFQAVGDAWSWLVNLFGDQSDVGRGWGEGIIDGVVSVIDSFTNLINWFRNFSLADLIADAVSGAGEILSNAVSGALQLVRDLLPSSDARTGPLSDLTRSGRSIMETLSDGVRRSAPLRVALTAGALTLPPVDQIVSPVVEDLVGNLPEVSQTVNPAVSGLDRLATDLSPVAQVVSPVVEDLNRSLDPIEQTVSPVVSGLDRLAATTLPDVEQTVSPVVSGLDRLAATTLPDVEQTVSPVVSGLDRLATDLSPVAQVVSPVVEDLNRTLAPIDQTVSPVVQELTSTLEPIEQTVSPVVSGLDQLATTLPSVDQSVSPVVQDLVSLPAIDQTVNPVVSSLDQLSISLPPVAQTVSPVVEDLNRLSGNLPDVEQTVSPVVRGLDQLATTLPPIEQTVSPVTDGLPNLPGGLADIDNLERFFPVGPVPLPPVPAAATSRETTVTIRIEEGAIQIRSDGNSREIAEAVHRGLAEAVRDAVEQADSQVIV